MKFGLVLNIQKPKSLTTNDFITIPIDNVAGNTEFDLCESKICNDRIQAYDCGDEVAQWLSYHLNFDGLRLVRQAKNSIRKSKKFNNNDDENSGKLSLSNQAQYLLINNQSVNWLQQIIGDDEEIDYDTFFYRFRGNFYIEGASEFSENSWSRIKIGDTKFKVESTCGRCQMICIDPHTGKKNRKPLVALSRALNGKLQFGIYLSHADLESGATIKVGDLITVSCDE